MTPIDWATLPLKKYADFSGRARRKEYWFFYLLVIVAYVVAMTVDGILDMGSMLAGYYGPLTGLLALALIVPSLAVGARRLHDTDRSGWWLLIGFVPLIGALVLLYFFVIEGTNGPNRYGPDPLEGERAGQPGMV